MFTCLIWNSKKIKSNNSVTWDWLIICNGLHRFCYVNSYGNRHVGGNWKIDVTNHKYSENIQTKQRYITIIKLCLQWLLQFCCPVDVRIIVWKFRNFSHMIMTKKICEINFFTKKQTMQRMHVYLFLIEFTIFFLCIWKKLPSFSHCICTCICCTFLLNIS